MRFKTAADQVDAFSHEHFAHIQNASEKIADNPRFSELTRQNRTMFMAGYCAAIIDIKWLMMEHGPDSINPNPIMIKKWLTWMSENYDKNIEVPQFGAPIP